MSLGKAIYVFRQADGAGIKQTGGVVSLPHLFEETAQKFAFLACLKGGLSCRHVVASAQYLRHVRAVDLAGVFAVCSGYPTLHVSYSMLVVLPAASSALYLPGNALILELM